MKRIPVESDTLNSVGYAPCASVLEIEFAGGELYQYLNVPTSIHEALLAASSKDSFFNEHIRKSYAVRRIGGPPAG
jgi:hypothetical protein